MEGLTKLALTGTLLSSLALGGCATIFTGTKDSVNIDSSPRGAEVAIDGKTYGFTPYQANLTRRDSYDVRLEKEGYEVSYHTIGREFNPVVIANLFFPGIIFGGIVDLLTGAAFNFDKSYIYGELIPKDKAKEQ